jgi:hypothetical protein
MKELDLHEAAAALHNDISLADALDAYATFRSIASADDSLAPELAQAQRLLTIWASYFVLGSEFIAELGAFSKRRPGDAHAVAVDTLGRTCQLDSYEQLATTNYPGLVNKKMYDLLNMVPHPDRSTYLRQRIDNLDPPLSDDARSLALALAEEWVGTMPDLVDTARALSARVLDRVPTAP